MGRILKVVVTGAFSAGKSEFVRTISDIDVVQTERKVTNGAAGPKAHTTVAMDYGRVRLGNDVIHLNGTPGQARFDFMWEILAHEMNGFVVLVDSCDPKSFAHARQLIDEFQSASAAPYLVAANKQDLDCASSADDLRRQLKLERDVLVIPCVARRKTSVKQVLQQVIDLVPD